MFDSFSREEFLREFMDSAPNGMLISEDGLILQANTQILKLFGYSREDLVGQSVEIMMPERYRAGHGKQLRKYFKNPTRREMGRGLELSGERKDGTEIPIEISLSPISQSDGLIVVSSIRDVSYQREQQAILHRSNERFRRLMDSAPDGILLMDELGMILETNSQLSKVFGYTKDELDGQTVEFFMPKEDLEKRGEVLRRYLQNPKLRKVRRSFLATGRHKNGHKFPIEISLSPLDDPSKFMAVSVIRDITNRHQREAALLESETRCRTLIRNIPGVVYRCRHDQDWMAHFVSEDIYALTGYPASDFTGEMKRTLGSLIHVDDHARIVEEVGQGIATREPWNIEYRIVRADDSIRWVGETGRAVFSGAEVSYLDGVISDITERKEMQAQLEIARKDADRANHAKSDFLSHMSHELRTPLNGILGYAQVMQRSDGLKKGDRERLDSIVNCGDHLLALINDVLDLSKIEAGHLELDLTPSDLHRILEGVANIIRPKAEEKALKFRMQIGPDVPVGVFADPAKIRQILINLLGNAIKFTPEGGAVTLSVCKLPDSRYRFQVTDTGCGMSEEEIEIVFDPFKQVDAGKIAGGTGLGLAICVRLTSLMNGELTCQSAIGKGSHFDFTIPLTESDATDLSSLSAEELDTTHLHLPEGADITVLIADDRPVNVDILDQMLQDIGFKTLTADDGDVALEILETHKVDLVLSDVRMPRMNGIEVVQAIRARPEVRDLPVIAVTASVFPEFREKAIESGFDDFLPKPFRASELIATLQKHLGIEFVKNEPLPNAQVEKGSHEIADDIKEGLRAAIAQRNVSAIKKIISEIEN